MLLCSSMLLACLNTMWGGPACHEEGNPYRKSYTLRIPWAWGVPNDGSYFPLSLTTYVNHPRRGLPMTICIALSLRFPRYTYTREDDCAALAYRSHDG